MVIRGDGHAKCTIVREVMGKRRATWLKHKWELNIAEVKPDH